VVIVNDIPVVFEGLWYTGQVYIWQFLNPLPLLDMQVSFIVF
jgi:hypothetical protein